jgi:hypothetical protein
MNTRDVDNEMTPYEKTINGDTMTLTEHLDNIADNDRTMYYDEFKQKLESITPHSKLKNRISKYAPTNRF